MGSLREILNHPEELLPLLKLKMKLMSAGKQQIPPEPHWNFCYSILHKVSRSFAFVIHQLDGAEIRNAMCIFYLVLRAIDTIEDDTSIPADIKVPILIGFHKHIYDHNWHFSSLSLCPFNQRRFSKDLQDQTSNSLYVWMKLERDQGEEGLSRDRNQDQNNEALGFEKGLIVRVCSRWLHRYFVDETWERST